MNTNSLQQFILWEYYYLASGWFVLEWMVHFVCLHVLVANNNCLTAVFTVWSDLCSPRLDQATGLIFVYFLWTHLFLDTDVTILVSVWPSVNPTWGLVHCPFDCQARSKNNAPSSGICIKLASVWANLLTVGVGCDHNTLTLWCCFRFQCGVLMFFFCFHLLCKPCVCFATKCF